MNNEKCFDITESKKLTADLLMEFIKSDLNYINFIYSKNNIFTIIKVKYDNNNIFLYYIFSYENNFKLSKDPTYAGFYNFKKNTFFDVEYYIRNLIVEKYKIENISNVIDEINKNISSRVYEIINNFNDSKLEEKAKNSLTSSDMQSIDNYKKDYANEAAETLFLNDEEIKFHITVEENYTMQDIINYLDNKDAFIEFKAQEYITSNLRGIYMDFIYNKLVALEYKKILNDKQSILHAKKAISDSITDQKTVNVTILKNDINFTFKTDADSLKMGKHHNYYSTYFINAKDRERFYKTFGRSTDYTADEIQKITYSKKVIYKKSV